MFFYHSVGTVVLNTWGGRNTRKCVELDKSEFALAGFSTLNQERKCVPFNWMLLYSSLNDCFPFVMLYFSFPNI